MGAPKVRTLSIVGARVTLRRPDWGGRERCKASWEPALGVAVHREGVAYFLEIETGQNARAGWLLGDLEFLFLTTEPLYTG